MTDAEIQTMFQGKPTSVQIVGNALAEMMAEDPISIETTPKGFKLVYNMCPIKFGTYSPRALERAKHEGVLGIKVVATSYRGKEIHVPRQDRVKFAERRAALAASN